MRRLIFISGAVILGIFFFFHTCEAISIIQLDQSKIRIIAPPGSAKAGAITIDNNTEYPRSIRAYLEDWYYASADGSKDFNPAGATELSCANWISFVPAEFTIPAYARQKINYTVTVPQGAKGGHYAILFLEESPAKAASEGVSVGLAVRVGCLFYVEPAGTINRTAQLDNLNIDRKSKDKLEIGVDFKNTGNVDITAGGDFNIIDKKGMVYARSKFNDVYTFAGDVAKLNATWREKIPQGNYILVLTLDLGKALEELNISRGPVIIKEAEIEIGANGEVVRVGELK